MAGGAGPRWCMLRMGDAAVAVRNLPFRIGAWEDADMIVEGGMSCSIHKIPSGLELLSFNGAALVNGAALGEGGFQTLRNGDVVAMAAGGLQFAVEDIREEANAQQRGGSEEAGALEKAMEKCLECTICMETIHRATALLPCMHTVCAGCASKSLARSDTCPLCRTMVLGVGKVFALNAAVDVFHASVPGRKRPAEELSKMDEDEESLAGQVQRIVRQRHGVSILQAVQDGDLAAVLDGLLNGADVNERPLGGGSLLHIAVDAEDIHMVRALLASGPDLEVEAADGTALNLAAQIGDFEILLALLEAGADGDEIIDLEEGGALLMEAARRGLARAVGALVQDDANGVSLADSSETDEDGVFPLLEASRRGFPEVVRALLRGGAAADQATTIADRYGDEHRGVTALLVACAEGHGETVEALLEWGATPCLEDALGVCPLLQACQSGHADVARRLLRKGVFPNRAGRGKEQETALIAASAGGFVEVVRALLEHGVDVHQGDHRGRSALFFACQCDPEVLERYAKWQTVWPNEYVPRDRRPLDVVSALLEHGADANQADRDGECALRMTGDVGRVRIMRTHRADVNQCDSKGRSVLLHCMDTQLHLEVHELGFAWDEGSSQDDHPEEESSRVRAAAMEKSWGAHLEVVLELAGNGADVRGAPVLLASMQGLLALLENGAASCDGGAHAAALGGQWAVVRALLDAGAGLFHADGKGNTALHLACQAGHTDAVRAMAGGSLIDTGNHEGGTALMAASYRGHVECVRALLGAGASVSVVDAQGRHALWWALGLWKVVQALVAAGVDEAIKGAALERAVRQGWDEVAQVLRGEEVRDRFHGFDGYVQRAYLPELD